MQRLLVSAVIFGGLFSWTASAQHGGGGGGGRAAGGHSGFASGGTKAGRAGNWRGNNNQWQRGGGFAGYGGWGYSDWNYGGWDYPYNYWDAFYAGYGMEEPPAPMVPMIQPGFPPPPPMPVHPVIQVYHWAENPAAAPAHFSLVAKNGQVREALAVWVQDAKVRYMMAGGFTGAFAPTSIDCGATDRLNTANQLRLALPGCALSK
ncbi:MAG TPA: hypothetical protein VGF49_11290 [Candidatus Solibacter sp.]|jgi:hypothetical protein